MSSKPRAPESVSFNVRLSKAEHAYLLSLAQQHGVEVAQLIRWAVQALRQHVESHGGRLHLPLDFSSVWQRVEAQAAAHRPGGLNEPPSERRARA